MPVADVMTCSVPGCEKKAEKRGWCAMHYRRWRIHGDTSVTLKAGNGEGYVQGGYLGHQINGERVFDHVRVAEQALGRKLPAGAVVHHANEDKTDNRPTNLVICPSKAYHNLIHARMAAMDACGDPNKRPCRRCHQYDDLTAFQQFERPNGSVAYAHAECERAYSRNLYWKKKEQRQ